VLITHGRRSNALHLLRLPTGSPPLPAAEGWRGATWVPHDLRMRGGPGPPGAAEGGPCPRYFHTCTAVGGSMLVFGGEDHVGTASGEMFELALAPGLEFTGYPQAPALGPPLAAL
jgi:hypothetical protein